MFALALALAGPALADTITLDTGATIEGDLARYELDGDCQISVAEGPLQGVIVIVPCHRVQAFVRVTRTLREVIDTVEPNDGIAEEPPGAEEPLPPEVARTAEAPPVAPPYVQSADDPPAGPEGDAEEEEYERVRPPPQPQVAPLMPSVARPVSF